MLRHDVGLFTVTCENTQGETMSTTSRSPEATEQEGPVIRTSSRSGLADSAWEPHLMTIAALAVVSMILLVP